MEYNVQYPSDPIPSQFNVVKWVQYGQYCVLKVNYPNCTTFEGDKIIVAKGDGNIFKVCKELDPHFHKNGTIIARFIPTEQGWELAKRLAEMLTLG